METRSSYCHKMLCSINGFLVIKQNMEFFERMGVASALTEMDMSEVETFINQATVEGTLQQEKLATMLQAVTSGVERIGEAANDESLDDLMKELDEGASEAKVADAAAHEGDLTAILGELDQAAEKGAKAADGFVRAKTPVRRESPQKQGKPITEEHGAEEA